MTFKATFRNGKERKFKTRKELADWLEKTEVRTGWSFSVEK